MRNIYSHNIFNLPWVIDSSLNVFCGKKTDVAKKSYPYIMLLEEKDNLLDALAVSSGVLGLKDVKIKDDKVCADLAALCRIYIDSFFYPIPFFLP